MIMFILPLVNIIIKRPRIFFNTELEKINTELLDIIGELCYHCLSHINERLCESCESVEDEYHVLMQCPKYDDIRTVAFESIM